MNNGSDTNHFKQKLEQELALVQKELARVGQRNPNNKEDWEGKPADFPYSADDNETADKIEEFEENTALVRELEEKYNDIKDALKKIGEGTYGVCEVSGEIIEQDRLEANPAARTCKLHME